MSGRDEQDEERTRRFYDATKSLGVDSLDLGPPIQVFVPEEDAPMTPEKRELLPCPFCGGPAEITPSGAFVRCPKHTRDLRPSTWNQRSLLTDREGFVTVPTEEMINAGHKVVARARGYRIELLPEIFKAMIAAATKEPRA